MAEQRQPFRFRLPWLPAPAPQSPSQPAPAPAPPAPAQRRPFRPAGVAPTQPPSAQSPSRAEPQPPSQSRATSQPLSQSRMATPSRAPPASPTRDARQTQVISQPTSPARRISPQPAPQTAIQSSSPSRVATQTAKPKVSAAPPRAPSQPTRNSQPGEKPQSPSKKSPTTVEISQAQKEPIKQKPQEQQPLAATPPHLEKVVESPEGQKKEADFQESKPTASAELVKGVADLKPEFYQASYEEPRRKLRGMNHEEPKEKKALDTEVPGLNAEPKGHPLDMLDERGQHPEEEVFEEKEVPKSLSLRIGGHQSRHTEADIYGNGKENRFPHKPETAGEKASLHKEMKAGPPKFVHRLGAGRDKHPLHEKPSSIITLTGENTGATMHLNSESSKRERSIHIHRGFKTNPDESVETADGEGSLGDKKSGDSKLQEGSATKLYVNNNAQGINNSLVFNSSVTERNPGVHVIHSHKPVGSVKPGNERKTVETLKSEVAATPAERLAYAPTVRRRCLRGLFLESSDSDTENPDKPRHHGCRVGCNQKSKDGTIDVL